MQYNKNLFRGVEPWCWAVPTRHLICQVTPCFLTFRWLFPALFWLVPLYCDSRYFIIVNFSDKKFMFFSAHNNFINKNCCSTVRACVGWHCCELFVFPPDLVFPYHWCFTFLTQMSKIEFRVTFITGVSWLYL